MNDYIKIGRSDVRAGDVLMHENGDRLTVTARSGSSGDIYVVGLWRSVASLEAAGFTPHRKVEPLPTEPGSYIDKDGKPWIYALNGYWIDEEGDHYREDAREFAPFTRLVPMPTEEQVEQCLRGPGIGVAEATDAVMALLEGETDD